MGKVNKSEFARLAGVSPAAVWKGIKTGNLFCDKAGMMDTENPANASYMFRNEGKREGTAKKTATGGNGTGGLKGRALDGLTGLDILAIREQKDLADIRMKNAAADRHLIAKAERLGLLILRSEVDQMMQVLGAEIRTRFLDMPRRIAPQIAAMVEADQGDREIEKLLDTEITDAIRHAKEAARRAGLGDL
jgi:hypothetical protein